MKEYPDLEELGEIQDSHFHAQKLKHLLQFVYKDLEAADLTVFEAIANACLTR